MSDYYIINKIRKWPEEFTPEEQVFLDIMADSSATSIVRIWGTMDPNDRKWWPPVSYKMHDKEYQLPHDILPNLKMGHRLDLKTGEYIN